MKDRKKACPMKSILEELFYGQFFPFERIVPHDPRYRPLNQKISGLKQKLQERLPAEDYQTQKTWLNWKDESPFPALNPGSFAPLKFPGSAAR